MTKQNLESIGKFEVNVGGTTRIVPFTLEEYEARKKHLKEIMAREKVDMVYITQPDDIFYFTGFDSCWYRAHSGRPWIDMSAGGVACHIDKDDYICYENPAEEALLWRESIATDVRIFADDGREMYGKTYHGITKDTNFVDCVVDDLAKSGWLGCTVGMSLGGHRPSPSVAGKLIAGFEAKGCKVVDMTDPVREVRQIKSPKEIEYTLKAGEFMNNAVQELKRKVEPGMTELQVTAIYEAALRNAGSENMGIVNMCRSGIERLYSFHAPAGRRTIEKGKPFAIDFSGVYNRYHCNNSRVFCIGEPELPEGHEKEIVECLRKSHNVKELMAKLIKPNMKVEELMEPVKEYYQELGVWGKQFWTGGYEIGIAYPPDWCGTMVYGPKEFHFNSDEFDDIRFVPGTVMNFEQGFVSIDTVVFSEDDARIIGTSTWDVNIIGA